ncbi:hypothetical protein NG800_018495 [Epilithonimonas ginsengisoli]|uniref:Uncharacterized protein n=1 Tax=Epilithonimonas ginsengisoli TaxID=1245592 RepID=A0ABU4JN14_9FLAO|nr:MULTISPECIES: hypothetical protein [Chryseobacterium group]MBV6881762.1 hypothetical protein [Epilithonimonas sp. FP105]MDW8550923.1 hypothetical protein [Epilithonimonas ginsengisoli]OAH66490.1 hypothetical protein AXA65_17960 [Chryseobacterium sp. FP211-J200]
MSIIRITEGTHTTEIEGSWTVFTDKFDAYAGQFSHFTSEAGTNFGIPDATPKVSDDAFIPVITPINDDDLFKSYKIVINKNEEWTFDDKIDTNLRNQKSHEINFISDSQIVRIKFKAEKGSSNANDSDGGNLKIWYFSDEGKGNSSDYKIIEDIKYGDTFFVDWDKRKNIFQLQFYADDNDWYFDGEVKNVYCGAIKLKGSKVGKRLTSNIEESLVASISQQLPGTHTSNFPEESFKVANLYQNPHGMCFAITMKRVEKAYFDEWNITDAIIVNTKHEDYRFSGTIIPTIEDKYFGYGVGGALSKNGYGNLVPPKDIWEGKLEEGAMIQYWNDYNEIGWTLLKEEIKNALRGKNAPNFDGGHSVIFKSYIYDNSGNIIGIKYYDYAGIHREFSLGDKAKKIMMGTNLKDKK